MALKILIVAEVGKKVGWGHVARSSLLRRLLITKYAVEMKIVNRERWSEKSLEDKYSLNGGVVADIVFFDGLSFKHDVIPLVSAQLKVSLSYQSDINSSMDYVVAPALHGMKTPSNYVTSLAALLCNFPSMVAASEFPKTSCSDLPLVGVCMGGADVDSMTPAIANALENVGYKTKFKVPMNSGRKSLECFVKEKLKITTLDCFPYYEMADCDIVICQGGLSAVEFAVLGVPTVIRRRPGFADAYRFLETLGCARWSNGSDIHSLINSVSSLTLDCSLREKMKNARRLLMERTSDEFWLSFIDEITNRSGV